ncbi:uncharacterized protein LOC142235971 [Haematobia irritans]|uniref:uncharacterized protein LOC142235971 n=1 Tax=Haematobia irritans TaxID=7368 RepID=UPI003F50A0BC
MHVIYDVFQMEITKVSLHNGIPQGSPLSVTLFIIAFDDLSRLLTQNKRIEHCLYADDLYIIVKNKSNISIQDVLINTLSVIDEWSKVSGANISFDKTKHLHICNKRNCRPINITYNNNYIENCDTCKILGVHFDHKYNFKNHCISLKKSLQPRLNIIKYLSSPRSYVHTNNLLKIAQAIILSKIDYGLILYNVAPKTAMSAIESTMHNAIRSSLRAFRTTPVQNLLAESGFESLPERSYKLKCRLSYKTICIQPNILSKELLLLGKRKTNLRCPSALFSIFKISKNLGLTKFKTHTHKYPPWALDTKLFDASLTNLNKNNTNPTIFRSLSNEIFTNYKMDGWDIVFTDGSKTTTNTSFAVVSENGDILSTGLVHEDSSIYDAEALAIQKALEICSKRRGKTLICSDSRSVFNACSNCWNKHEFIVQIQQLMLDMKNRVKLMWIPSHVGIAGNEKADCIAKEIPSYFPTYSFIPANKNFLIKLALTSAKQNTDSHWDLYTFIFDGMLHIAIEKGTMTTSCTRYTGMKSSQDTNISPFGGRPPKKIEDAELDGDDTLSQKQMAAMSNVAQQTISGRLKAM